MTTLTDLIARSSAPMSVNVTSTVLHDAAEEVKIEQHKKLVSSVKGLLESFDADVKHQVATLREYRKQEASQAARVKELDRAFHYFASTGNPLPMFAAQMGGKLGWNRKATEWCERAGVEVPKNEDDAWKVPADFVPANS